jgi:hypothetical protein
MFSPWFRDDTMRIFRDVLGFWPEFRPESHSTFSLKCPTASEKISKKVNILTFWQDGWINLTCPIRPVSLSLNCYNLKTVFSRLLQQFLTFKKTMNVERPLLNDWFVVAVIFQTFFQKFLTLKKWFRNCLVFSHERRTTLMAKTNKRELKVDYFYNAEKTTIF